MIIGVIGVGAMGGPIAQNLAAPGNEVWVFDAHAERMKEIAVGLIKAAASCADIASKCELIITMLPDDAVLRAVIGGPQGVIEGAQAHSCLIDLSTTSLRAARDVHRELQVVQVEFMDGAVIGGGVKAAKAAESPIVIGGDRGTFDRFERELRRLGDVSYVGALGCGKVVKIINNLLVGGLVAANAEAVTLGRKGGVDEATVVDCLIKGSGTTHVLESYFASYIKTGKFGEGLIPISYMIKDLSLACELAKEFEFPAMLCETSRQLFEASMHTVEEPNMFPEIYSYFLQSAGIRQ